MPGDPHSGSKVWKAADREIGKPGENRGTVIRRGFEQEERDTLGGLKKPPGT
jgi:hypothetical protein